MSLRILPLARQDILDHFQFLVDAGAVEVGDRFLKSIQYTVSLLQSHPRLGIRQPTTSRSLQNLYKWPVAKFRLVWIYYQVDDNRLTIIRVLHDKRNVRRLLSARVNR